MLLKYSPHADAGGLHWAVIVWVFASEEISLVQWCGFSVTVGSPVSIDFSKGPQMFSNIAQHPLLFILFIFVLYCTVNGTASLSNNTDQQRNGSCAIDFQDSALEGSVKEPGEWSANFSFLHKFLCIAGVMWPAKRNCPLIIHPLAVVEIIIRCKFILETLIICKLV